MMLSETTTETETSAPEILPPRRCGRQKGMPRVPGSGRVAGTKNRRTLEIEALLRPTVPGIKRRLREIIKDPNVEPELFLRAAQLVFAYVYGRPVERKEISGPDGAPVETRNTSVTVDATRFAEIVGKMLSGHPHLRRAS
jgi:hypothetical protein